MSDATGILSKLQGKLLEVSVGDEYEEIVLSDHVQKINGVIYGTLVDIIGDFFVLNCYYMDNSKNLRQGNLVYLNSWNIKAFTELNNEGSLNDVFLSAPHTRRVKELLKGLSK